MVAIFASAVHTSENNVYLLNLIQGIYWQKYFILIISVGMVFSFREVRFICAACGTYLKHCPIQSLTRLFSYGTAATRLQIIPYLQP